MIHGHGLDTVVAIGRKIMTHLVAATMLLVRETQNCVQEALVGSGWLEHSGCRRASETSEKFAPLTRNIEL